MPFPPPLRVVVNAAFGLCLFAIPACATTSVTVDDDSAESDLTGGAVHVAGESVTIDASRDRLSLRFGGHAGDLLRITVVSKTEVPRIDRSTWQSKAHSFSGDETPIPVVNDGGRLVFGLRLARTSTERENTTVIGIESKSGAKLGSLALTVERVEDGVAIMNAFDTPPCADAPMTEAQAEALLGAADERHLVDAPLRKRTRRCGDGPCDEWTFGYLAKYFATPESGSRLTVGGANFAVAGPAAIVLRRNGGAPSIDLDVVTNNGAGASRHTALRCAVGGSTCTVVEPIGFPSTALYPGASAAPHFDVGAMVPARVSARCFYALMNGSQSTGSAFGIPSVNVSSSLMATASFPP